MNNVYGHYCFFKPKGILLSVAKLDSELCFALYSASNYLTSIYRPLLEEYDLTYPQFVVLMALWEADDISISQLAKKSGLGKATMTPLLKRLEQKLLIQRTICPDNERQKSITLTRIGRDLSKHSSDITKKVFCTTGLSEQQAHEMIAMCHQIVK